MIYLTCPTCGYFIGQKTHHYDSKKKKICDNPKLGNSEKEAKLKELLAELGLRRYCCKMRVMTAKDMVELLVPPE